MVMNKNKRQLNHHLHTVSQDDEHSIYYLLVLLDANKSKTKKSHVTEESMLKLVCVLSPVNHYGLYVILVLKAN